MQIKHRIFFYEIKPIFVADHKKYFLQHTKKLKSKNFHCLWFQKSFLFYLRKNISHCLWFEKSFLFYLRKKYLSLSLVSKNPSCFIWKKKYFSLSSYPKLELIWFKEKYFFYLRIKHFTPILFGKMYFLLSLYQAFCQVSSNNIFFWKSTNVDMGKRTQQKA